MKSLKPIRLTTGLILLALLAAALPAVTNTAQAQETPAPETAAPTADVDTGLLLFADRCANCHGPAGAGDGEMVTRLPAPPRAFNDAAYIRQAVPASMFLAITNGNLDKGMPPFGPSSSNAVAEADRWNLIAAVFSLGTSPDSVARGQQLFAELNPDLDAAFMSDPVFWRDSSNQDAYDRLQTILPDTPADDIWAMVDYGRATYPFSGTAAAVQLNGVITGMVMNGTTGSFQGDMPALLRAFDPIDFSITLALTSTVNADGSFQFAVAQAPADWIYMASVAYNEISFSSDIGRLSSTQTSAELPITVYDPTSDASVVSIDRLHIIMDVADNVMEVNELYTFSNNSSQVYVGATGNMSGGTILIPLPAQAQTPVFQRGFGSLDSFVAANELFPTDEGWLDTLPLRPGPNSMNLLVRYTLPYESGMTLAHALPYVTETSSVILPDNGITVSGNWQSSGPQEMEGQGFVQYTGERMDAGSTLTMTLEGEPRQAAAAGPISSTTGIIIGGAAILTVVGAAIFVVQRQRKGTVQAVAATREELLAELAALDDAYASGEVDAGAYEQERQQLKEELLAIWNSTED